VAEESFELEQPYEAPTLVGIPTPYGGDARSQGSAGAIDSEPIAVADVDESFDLEPERAAATMPAPQPVPAAAVPWPPAAAIGGEQEASFDFDAVPEPVEPWSPPQGSYGAPEASAASQPRGAADLAMSTATLAELYLSQGVLDKAIDVYSQLLEREPDNQRARARLGEIKALEGQSRPEEARAGAPVASAATAAPSRREAIERTIARLEALLTALKRT